MRDSIQLIRWKYNWWLSDHGLTWDAISRRIAWLLPKRVVMWCYYRVISDEPDPEIGTRNVKPIEAVDQWSRFNGLY